MGGEAKAPAERRDLARPASSAVCSIAPAVILTAAGLLGFRGAEFVTLIAITTTPCAVASFTMAQQMDSDAVLAGNAVVISSALSCFTMFGWIFGAKMLGLF
jgi:predicted permease